MRRLLPLLLCLGLTSACSSKDGGDDDDDDGSAEDLTSDWGDGGSDGADGGSDGADGGGDLTSEEAARLLAEGVCDWIGMCYGYEVVGVRDHDECVQMQLDGLRDEFSDCDVDRTALGTCLDELERSTRECDEPGSECTVQEICP